jgi:uncharacterized protein YjiS (DUF1127 family)
MAMTDVAPYRGWTDALAPLAGWPEETHQAHRYGLIVRLWTRYRAWQAQRETVRALSSLDHGTLRDLGINPREIESLVYGDSGDRMRGYDPDWWRR